MGPLIGGELSEAISAKMAIYHLVAGYTQTMSTKRRKTAKSYARKFHRQSRQMIARLLRLDPENAYTRKPRNSAKWDAS